MTSAEILEKIKSLENKSVKKVLIKHGAKEPFYGVKIEELKKIQKIVKKDYKLALELYDSGISDAMYLAGMIADESKMTKKDIQQWVKNAYWNMLSEYTVAWVASESKFGTELAMEWIDDKAENIASSGWATWADIVSLKPDAELDLALLKKLLLRIEKQIHEQPNRVRYTMNGFVIAVGLYVGALTEMALQVAARIGKVSVNLGDTACKVPAAADYIKKVLAKKEAAKKKKTVRC